MTLRKKKQEPHAQKYCFTVNNPDDVNIPLNFTDVKYLRWQYEVGSSGTPHLQGFIWLSKQKRITQLRKKSQLTSNKLKEHLLRITLTVANVAMITKSLDTSVLNNAYLALGKWAFSPKANGSIALLTMIKMVDDGKDNRAIKSAFPAEYARHYRAIDHIRFIDHATFDPRNAPNIIWLWGESGCGKTLLIRQTFPHAYWKPKGNWWNGYNFEDAIIFDDFYSWIELDEMLRILDRSPMMVQTKGGYTHLKATTFIFTSNDDPRDCYKNVLWTTPSLLQTTR